MIDFIHVLFNNSITMSFFIAVYAILLRVFLKNTKAKGHYYSWLIIVFGFIIPVKPDFHITVETNSLFAKFLTTQQTISETIVNERIGTNLRNKVFFLLWLLGIMVFFIYHLKKHNNFIKLIRRWSKKIEEPEFLEVLVQLQNELKIKQTIQLMSCSVINTPMMVGFLKPKIILPDSNSSFDEIQYILKHELIHLKRKDIWYKYLIFLVSAFHWFNPFIYLMAKEISVQCELSCDEEVMKGASDDQRKNYSAILLSVIKNHGNTQFLFITNFYGTKDIMKERILSILNVKKKKTAITTIVLLAIGIGLTGTTFSLKANNNDLKIANPIVTYEPVIRDDVQAQKESTYVDENQTVKDISSADDKASSVDVTEEEYFYKNRFNGTYYDLTEGYLFVSVPNKEQPEKSKEGYLLVSVPNKEQPEKSKEGYLLVTVHNKEYTEKKGVALSNY